MSGTGPYRTLPLGHVGATEVARVQALATAQQFLEALKERELNVATAESLTAGLISSTLVDVPMLSNHVYGGCVVYDSDAKRMLLKVQVPNVYSEECAAEMATGLLAATRAAVAIAVTGHASIATMQDAELLGRVDMSVAVRQADDNGDETAPIVRTRAVHIGQETAADATADPDTDVEEAARDAAVVMAFLSAFDLNAGACAGFKCASLIQLYGVRDYIRQRTVARALRFALRVVLELTPDQIAATIVQTVPYDGKYTGCGEPSAVLHKHLPPGSGVPPGRHPPSDLFSAECAEGVRENNARKRRRRLWGSWTAP